MKATSFISMFFCAICFATCVSNSGKEVMRSVNNDTTYFDTNSKIIVRDHKIVVLSSGKLKCAYQMHFPDSVVCIIKKGGLFSNLTIAATCFLTLPITYFIPL